MAIVAYLRVSSEEQAESGLGIEGQLADCLAWCVRKDSELGPVFRDEGRSGGLALDKRTVLLDAIASLRKGDVLLVAKRDRLHRGDPVAVGLIEKAIAKRGARLVSAAGEGTADDSVDSITQRRFTDLLAERERLVTAERTVKALRAKKDRGERYGQVPYGWRLGEPITIEKRDRKGRLVRKTSHRIEPDDREADVAFRAAELRALGVSLGTIARGFDRAGIPTKSGRPWNKVTVGDLARRYLESQEIPA